MFSWQYISHADILPDLTLVRNRETLNFLQHVADLKYRDNDNRCVYQASFQSGKIGFLERMFHIFYFLIPLSLTEIPGHFILQSEI